MTEFDQVRSGFTVALTEALLRTRSTRDADEGSVAAFTAAARAVAKMGGNSLDAIAKMGGNSLMISDLRAAFAAKVESEISRVTAAGRVDLSVEGA